MNQTEKALLELVTAIERRYDGESDRKRSNALSPLIEECLDEAKWCLRSFVAPNCPECDLPGGAHLRHCSRDA